MKLFLNITIFYAILFSSSAMAGRISHLISLGDNVTCAFGEGRGKCWGLNWEETLSIGKVEKIAARPNGFCAIAQGDIKCLSLTDIMNKVPPQIIHAAIYPSEILTTYHSSDDSLCAISSSHSMVCWKFGETSTYRPRTPFFLTLNEFDLYKHLNFGDCAYKDSDWCTSKVSQKMALSEFRRQSPVDTWRNHGHSVCGLLYAGGYVCIDMSGKRIIPQGGEGLLLRSKSCYLYKSHIRCSRDLENIALKIDTSTLKQTKAITNTKDSICILDDKGIRCWDEQGSKKYDLGPSMKAPIFVLSELPNFLSAVSKGSSLIKTKFYGNLLEYVSVELSKNTESTMEQFTQKAAQYTIASLLSSSIEDGDSQYYLNHVSPSYKDSMTKIEIETGLTGLNSVPDLSATRKASLRVIHASLGVIDNFLTSSEKERMQFTLRLLGQALATPSNSDAVHSLLDGLAGMEDIFTKLSRSRKAAFLITTLNEAAEFLKDKTGY